MSNLMETPPARRLPIVAVGTSAGGLEALRTFLDDVPPASGMAFVLLQHLDPKHESAMVELLRPHTTMPVNTATHGTLVEADSVYVLPPGLSLEIKRGRLQLGQPKRGEEHFPFDVFLTSLAADVRQFSIGVVLSGNGTDGSNGIGSIREHGGLVVAQLPTDAAYDGMPSSAINTGLVDRVLPLSDIPNFLVGYVASIRSQTTGSDHEDEQNQLSSILKLLQPTTFQKITHYKRGTLLRRVQRRMTIVDVASLSDYETFLQENPQETKLLAQDLLVNVTQFFRDEWVFDLLAQDVLPDLLQLGAPDNRIRVWVPGCSTGEEAYSLAILLDEYRAKNNLDFAIQIFASDIDSDAVSTAREGIYPESIQAVLSAERLAKNFTLVDGSFRILPSIRSMVIFAIHDVLSDPPFAQINLVSCRNVLIYLTPDAQKEVISTFHLSLRTGGILLIGSSENLDWKDGRFEVLSGPARIYRHKRKSGLGEYRKLFAGSVPQTALNFRDIVTSSLSTKRENQVKEFLARKFSPSAILINRNHECLYTTGSLESYLRVPPGPPSDDLFAMLHDRIRSKIRIAVRHAVRGDGHAEVGLDDVEDPLNTVSRQLTIEPLQVEGEDLLLLCFIEREEPQPAITGGDRTGAEVSASELAAAKSEFDEIIQSLDEAEQRQKLISQEALSVNEEYQAANEELLASKEELQSLNEELTALNYQLNQTLERERQLYGDLQNVLTATDVATLFLDKELCIRFSTPAIRGIFNMLQSDIGRSIKDLKPLVRDDDLLDDALKVLENDVNIEREISGDDGTWYHRRVIPYRRIDHPSNGIVVTYTNITKQKVDSIALVDAERLAQSANLAKSRFLAAASHDLRQPLQAISLIHDSLVRGQADARTIHRLGRSVSAMKSVLNKILEINLIETGTLPIERVNLPVSEILEQMKAEFEIQATAAALTFHTVASKAIINSDPVLLADMIRNLISNAFNFTQTGKVLLGCRHRGANLSIEVLDTGPGIDPQILTKIFGEYYQGPDQFRGSTAGSGLGLSIVQSLGVLLEHKISATSIPGKGSRFCVEVPIGQTHGEKPHRPIRPLENGPIPTGRGCTILLVEDDSVLREITASLLAVNYNVISAEDGPRALDLMARGPRIPDVVIADYGLPKGMTGVDLVERARERLGKGHLPAIILTGAISEHALHRIAESQCVRLSKPVLLEELEKNIGTLIPNSHVPKSDVNTVPSPQPIEDLGGNIFIVEDNVLVREEVAQLLERRGMNVESFSSAESFLAAHPFGAPGCLLVDIVLPGMNGISLTRKISRSGSQMRIITFTGEGDVQTAVEALQAGAVDFLEKPISNAALLESVDRALSGGVSASQNGNREAIISGLTPRQHEVLSEVLLGKPSKIIAADLGISQRTVENHRAAIMRKVGARSLAVLVKKSFGIV